jgi:hypothetical protein
LYFLRKDRANREHPTHEAHDNMAALGKLQRYPLNRTI